MKSGTQSFDVVILGAGPAGATAAWLLASLGYRTALVEAQRLHEAGAHWVNGMPMKVFDSIGLERPQPPELLDEGLDTLMLDHSNNVAFVSRNNPMCNVDMRLLVDRLHRLARQAKVEVFDETRLDSIEFEQERPRALVLRQGKTRRTLRAQLFVDASGFLGELRRRVPAMQRECPGLRTGEVCTAAQRVVEIGDPEGARTFLELVGAKPGETINWLGVEGGYSTLLLSPDKDLTHAHIVTGTVLSPSGKSGVQMADAVQRDYPWLGKNIRQGEGLIPIRRPYERLAVPGLVLLGDAGCMVYSAHGSGAGMAMMAASTLAEALSESHDLGSLESVWNYEHQFHTRHGALLGTVAVTTRLFRRLSGAQSNLLVKNGIFQASTFESGLNLEMPPPTMGSATGLVKLGSSSPMLASRLSGHLARLGPVYAAYQLHPRRPSVGGWKLWANSVRALMGGSA